MKVTTQRLEEQASQLREISYRMRSIQDSVLRTAQILSREKIGERFRWPIRSAAAAVEKRHEDLMNLSKALREIAMIYERTEQDIVDEAEEANNHFQLFPTGLIPIPHLPPVIIPDIIPVPRPRPNPVLPDIWFPREPEPEPPSNWWDEVEIQIRDFILVGPDGRPPDPNEMLREWLQEHGREFFDQYLPDSNDPETRAQEIVDALPTLPNTGYTTDPDALAEAVIEAIPTTWGTDALLHGRIDWTPWDP